MSPYEGRLSLFFIKVNNIKTDLQNAFKNLIEPHLNALQGFYPSKVFIKIVVTKPEFKVKKLLGTMVKNGKNRVFIHYGGAVHRCKMLEVYGVF